MNKEFWLFCDLSYGMDSRCKYVIIRLKFFDFINFYAIYGCRTHKSKTYIENQYY